MTISKGDRVPHAQLTLMTEQGPSPVDAAELMAQGTTVLFAVPGAFTPTCSAQHLPGFVEHAGEITEKGVDRIICMAVNDVFVMGQPAQRFAMIVRDGEVVDVLVEAPGEFQVSSAEHLLSTLPQS